MKIYQIVGLFLIAIFITGCSKVKPIYNVNHGPIPSNASVKTIENTIIKALYSKGWVVASKKNGEIIANIDVRKHSATIKITYTDSSYKINYVDSNNLKYYSEDQEIHRNYNKWIILLEERIQQYFDNPKMLTY